MQGDRRPSGRVAATVTDPTRTRLHGRLVAIGLALATVGVGVVLGVVLGLLVAVVALSGSTDAGLIALVVASEAAYLLVGVGYLVGLSDGVPLARPSVRQVGAAALAGVALVVLGQAVLWLIPGAGIADVSSALGQSGVAPSTLLVLAAVSLAVVGPAEEVLFRGAVQGTLRLAFGRWPAVLGASALFTAVHAGALVGQPLVPGLAALAVIGLVAVVLGVAFECTGSLAVPIVIHGLYDCLLLVGAYLLAT
ncbi:MAG: lysostaphin resistance A-like protein [Haloarculaceae archaeon]